MNEKYLVHIRDEYIITDQDGMKELLDESIDDSANCEVYALGEKIADIKMNQSKGGK